MKGLKNMAVLALVLAAALPLFGRGRTDSGGSSGGDTSREVHLVGYLLGEELVGMADVMRELNIKLKRDINATMEIRYIGWGDLASKYPLVLASGDLDWIYTAPWAFYSQEAGKGAFKELTQDLIRTYMPRHYAALDPVAYKQAEVEVNGKKGIYMIPTSTPDRKVGSILIRRDLRLKYGVPEIKRITDIEPYLEAIKKNEPGMTPMMLDNTYDIKRPWGDMMTERGLYIEDVYFATGSGLNVGYDIQDPTGRIHSIFDPDYRGGAIEAARKVKSWYDKGYINSDAFGNTVRSKEAFSQGKSAVAFGNSIDLQSNMATAVDNGWDVEIIPIVSPDRKAARDAYTNNGVAVAANSRNVERTLMALDLLMQESSYVMLDYFGIEGKNYVMTGDGKVAMPAGVTNDTNTYPPDAAGFWFVSKDLQPPLASWTNSYIAHRQELGGILINDALKGFQINKEPIKTEEANCANVFSQYGSPLFLGAVRDVDAAYAELERNAKTAGYDRCVEEARRQMAAFVLSLQ
ncbi:MAG: ABC transporter substrate-binding protein [Treponema sp.]|jgi:putative aldouronate transport system substrate-binding protein|nr:ABC transporter substrate-binding protein [Treponema sp.]